MPAAACEFGDLAAVGDEWVAGVQSAIETARAWRPDARLVTVQVGCAPLEAGFRWQGTFYSQTAQSFFFSDTGMSEPAEIDPASVPALPIEEVNFRELHLALARAGYGEDAELNPPPAPPFASTRRRILSVHLARRKDWFITWRSPARATSRICSSAVRGGRSTPTRTGTEPWILPPTCWPPKSRLSSPPAWRCCARRRPRW